MAAAAFGGLLDSPPDGFPGVHSAEAKDYYTRKRVNGRWITGHFPKRQFVVKQAPKRLVATRFASRSAPPPVTSPPVTSPPTASPRPASAAPTPQPLGAAASSTPAPEPLAPPPSDERMLRLRAALQAHAKTLATGSVLRGAPERALEPAVPSASPVPNTSPAPQPAAIAFDLQTGLKRTTFTDGSVLEEEFDVEAVKGGAAVPKDGRAPGTSNAP